MPDIAIDNVRKKLEELPPAQPRLVRAMAQSLGVERIGSRAQEQRDAIATAWKIWHGEIDVYEYAMSARAWSEKSGALWGGADATYFMRMEVPVPSRRRPVKIGRSLDPEARRMNLLCGSPYPITLLASVPCAILSESVAHAMFARLRLQGEWFRWSRGLDDLIVQAQRIMEINRRDRNA